MASRILSAHIHAEPENEAWTFTTGRASCGCREWIVAAYSAMGHCQFCGQPLYLDTTTVGGWDDAS